MVIKPVAAKTGIRMNVTNPKAPNIVALKVLTFVVSLCITITYKGPPVENNPEKKPPKNPKTPFNFPKLIVAFFGLKEFKTNKITKTPKPFFKKSGLAKNSKRISRR